MKTRKTSKAPPAKPMAWAQGYCNAPTEIFAEPRDIPCATLRPGVKFGTAKPEDYTVTHRKHTPAELAEREADRAELEAKARAVLAEHTALFEADAKGGNESLGLQLLALRRETEGGNAAAGDALRFLAREAMRMLQDIGRSADVLLVAQDGADWLRTWAKGNPEAAREAAKFERTWPVNMPKPRHHSEWEAAKKFVKRLDLESAQPATIREATVRRGTFGLGVPMREWLKLKLTKRAEAWKPEADWPSPVPKAAPFYAMKFREYLRNCDRERFLAQFPDVEPSLFDGLHSKAKDAKGSDNSQSGGPDYLLRQMRQAMKRLHSKGT